MKSTKIYTWLLLLCVALSVGFSSHAQQVVQIGTGTSTNTTSLYAPFYRYSGTSSTLTSVSNIAFTQSEMQAAGINPGMLISALSFNKTTANTLTAPAEFKILMANSNATIPLATTTAWASILSSHTLVYSNNNLTIPGVAGWVEFPLSSPFLYAGGTLEIAFDFALSSSTGSNGYISWEYTTGFATSIIGSVATNPVTLNAVTAAYKHRPNVKFTLQDQVTNDISAKEIVAPNGFCEGTQPIVVSVQNYGSNAVNNFTVNWSIDNVLQTPIASSTVLNTLVSGNSSIAQVNLGNVLVDANPKTIKVWTSGPNGQVDNNTSNDTFETIITPRLSGIYTINSAQPTAGRNFISFTDFTNRLSAVGVCGPVTVNVATGSGPYSGQIAIGDFAGAGPNNPVRINGNGNVITFATSTTTGERELVVLDGAKHVRIDSMIFRTTSSTAAWGAWITGQSEYDTLSNCTFDLSSVSSSSSANINGIVLSTSRTSATTGSATAPAGNNIVIEGNKIFGSSSNYGIYYGITLTTGVNNVTIKDNEISQYYNTAIYSTAATNLWIVSNDIHRTGRTVYPAAANYGIYLLNGDASNSIIEKNFLHDNFDANTSTTATTYAIYSLGDGTATEPVIIRNNIIKSYKGFPVYTIYLSSALNNLLYNNTVDLDRLNPAGSGIFAGIYLTGTNTGTRIINNNVSITNSNNANIYGFYYANNATFEDAQANNFYVNSANPNIISQNFGYHGAPFATLAAFQAAFPTLEVNGTDVDPMFNNPSTLDYVPNNPLLIFTGEDLGAALPDDYVGTTRSGNPTIGAFEKIVARVYDLAATAIVEPTNVCAGISDVVVNIANVAGLRVDSFTVNWSIDNVLQPSIRVIQTLRPLGSASGTDYNVTLGRYNFTPNPVEIKAWVSNPNNTVDTFNVNDTIISSVQARMGGTYTVNANAPVSATNFQSLAAFADQISAAGVCAPVVVNVVANSGPYTGKIEFKNIIGTSTVNTIRVNGNGNTVNVATTTTAGQREMLLIQGTSYLTIDSLNFVSNSTTGSWGALITGASTFDTVMRCTFDVSLNTSTSSANNNGIAISGLNTSPSGAGTAGNNIAIIGNRLIGSPLAGGMYYGISIASGGNDSIAVINNTVENYYYYGIYANATLGTLIKGNKIIRPNKTAGFTTNYGIYTNAVSNGLIVDGNTISDNTADTITTNTSTFYGIYLAGDGTALEPIIVKNNLIYNMTGGTMYGIYGTAALENKIYHNTIAFTRTTSSSSSNYGVYLTGTNTGTEFKNNNVAITAGGTGAKYGFYYSAAASIIDAQKNNFYLNSSNAGTQYYGYYTTNYATKAAFNAAYPTLELNSPQVDPMFVNVATGNFKPTNVALTFKGENVIDYVANDYLDIARSIAPTLGAYEEVPSLNNNLTVLEIVKPFEPMCADSQDVYAIILNAGTNTVSSFDVNVSYDGNVYPATTKNITLNTLSSGLGNTSDTVYIGRVLMSGTSKELKVWTSNPNGQADAQPVNDTATTTLSTTEFYVSTFSDKVCVGDKVRFTFYPQKDINDGDLEWYTSTDGINYSLLTGQNNLDLYTNSIVSTQYFKAKYVANGNNCETTPIKIETVVATLNGVRDTAICLDQDAQLIASTGIGSNALWYDSDTSTRVIYVGDTLSLSEVNETDTFYVQAAVTTASMLQVGPKNPTLVSGSSAVASIANKVFFDVQGQLNLKSVDVFVNAVSSAVGSITITNELTNQVVGTYTFNANVTGNTNAIKVDINEILPPGKYSMSRDATSPTLFRNSAGAIYPYGTGPLVITGTNYTSASYYLYFYNWQYEIGCPTPKVPVVVKVNPTPNVDLGRDVNVCLDRGETIELDAQNVDPINSYVWNNGSTSQIINVAQSGMYKVTVSNNYGCSDEDSLNVVIKANPISALGNDTVVCINTPVTLNAGNDGIRYFWNNGLTSNEITTKTSGDHIVFITASNGCVISDTVNIKHEGFAPSSDGLRAQNLAPKQFKFSAVNPANDLRYVWNFGDGSAESTEATPTHTYANTGNYTVTCTIHSSCGTKTDTVTVHMISTSVNNVSNDQEVKVYPNPTKDVMTVKLTDQNSMINKVTIVNVLGQRVVESEFKTNVNECTVDLSQLSDGNYNMIIETSKGILSKKVVKVN